MMKRQLSGRLMRLILLTISVLLLAGNALPGDGPKTRPAYVAGAFYPADRAELGKMLDEFLARVPATKLDGPLVAIISPHAGYEYSGQVAAYAYALLKGKKFERVVVIAPSHYEAFGFASIYDGDAYATPLGTVPVDKAFAARLTGLSPLIQMSGHGHGQVEGRGEHALEDELPFLQRVLGEFELVPIVMGDQSYGLCRELGVSLAKAIHDSSTLIVVSSDLSHYHPYDEAVSIDHHTLKGIEDWDYLSLSRNFESRVWEACGGGPIVAAMIAAERLGATRAIILKYANSGDVTGDKSRVVGYGAVALVKEKARAENKAAGFSLNGKEKEALLQIARKSVETAVREHKLYECSAGGLERLQEARGAFVTLKEHGELRGCIGYMTPLKPLCLTVRDVAALAALEDRRFTPVTPAELAQLEYEISVLSPMRRVMNIQEIKVGKHGLLIKKGEQEGVLLPQVPVEQGWDRQTFLEEVCLKAGMPKQAWRDEAADLYLFTALVFGEHSSAEPLAEEEPGLPKQRVPPGRPGPDSP
jgi:hypothetical protein